MRVRMPAECDGDRRESIYGWRVGADHCLHSTLDATSRPTLDIIRSFPQACTTLTPEWSQAADKHVLIVVGQLLAAVVSQQ
eukprot:15090124-Alexandrium_andersonii.AAC.1